jgi:hypothetical protein
LRLLAAAALLAALAVPAAQAQDVGNAELRRLAAQAVDDPAALARLRRVDSVDGRPVDLETALSGAGEEDLDRRLETLAGGAPAGRGSDAAAARDEAARVLADDRYHESELPRPLKGFLDWLGDQLQAVWDPIADRLPGGNRFLWALLGAAVVAIAIAVSMRTARRRLAAAEGATVAAGPEGAGRDPRELEREADEAERAGELERAIRLRFRAGLLRLDQLRLIRFRESLTSGEVARRLRSAAFDALARSFDEVVYGRRAPRPEDAAAARDGWQAVLAEARRG